MPRFFKQTSFFVQKLNIHEYQQNVLVKNLIGFHSDFSHLFISILPADSSGKRERDGKRGRKGVCALKQASQA